MKASSRNRCAPTGDDKLGDRPIANGRKDMHLKRTNPAGRGPRIAPLRRPQRMHPAGRFGKRRNGQTPAKLERVVAGTHRTTVAKGSRPSRTKRDVRIGPKTGGTATTADSDTLRPVAAPGRGDPQIEAVQIVVFARTDDGVDEPGGEARARGRHRN